MLTKISDRLFLDLAKVIYFELDNDGDWEIELIISDSKTTTITGNGAVEAMKIGEALEKFIAN